MSSTKQYSPPLMLKGWDTTNEEARLFRDDNKIFMAYMDMTAACDMNCVYCQARAGKPLPGELSLGERKNVLKQLADMRCKAIHFAGQGEPTLDKHFWEILQYVNELGMTPVVFTHGANLDREKILLLKALNTSLIIKVHSFNPVVQDVLVGKKGYSEKRGQILNMLMEEGFNQCTPTMLGIDTVMTFDNRDELESIFRFCRDNNIFPELKTMITANRAGKVVDKYQLHAEDVESIATHLLQIDQEEYGYTWDITPPYIAWSCNFYYGHIYVNILGDIYPCVGFTMTEPLGNVRSNSIEEIYNDNFMVRIRNIDRHITGICASCPIDCYGCPCRRMLKSGKTESVFETSKCWGDVVEERP